MMKRAENRGPESCSRPLTQPQCVIVSSGKVRLVEHDAEFGKPPRQEIRQLSHRRLSSNSKPPSFHDRDGFFFRTGGLFELWSISSDDQSMALDFLGITVEFELESIGQQCLKHLFELLGRRG